MSSKLQVVALALTLSSLCGQSLGQNGFSWTNHSIGGGGFCLEIRFDPYDIYRPAGSPPTLYLATDVSGLYRSTDLGNSWQPVWDPDPTSESDVPDAYLTTVAFNRTNARLIAGSAEGIYYGPAAGGDWRAAVMPARNDPGVPVMRAEDGRFPWIGIIREYPLNTDFMLAGIGDLREKPDTQHGLGALLRSIDGGQNWELVSLDGAETDEIVYDIDYVTSSSNSDSLHVFIATGHTLQNGQGYAYKGALYYSNTLFHPDPDSITFVKITSLPASNNKLVTNVVSLVPLCNSPLPTPVGADSPLHLWATRYAQNDGEGGGVYRAVTTLDSLIALAAEPLSHQATSINQPDWKSKQVDKRLGRLAAKTGATRSNFQLFLGKELGEEIYLAVTSHALAGGMNVFQRIVSPEWGTSDWGYRELDSDGNTQLRFGSLTLNPEDPNNHPIVYGCWGYGPLKAPPPGNETGEVIDNTFPLPRFDSPRSFRQIFTTKAGTDASGDEAYISRGMDEVFFNGQIPAFKPVDPKVVLLGCGDNGLLRTADIHERPVRWSQRRLATSQWYTSNGNTLNQFIYHLAFHPLNSNTVLVSAGTRNLRPNDAGRGGLLQNNLAGAGGPEDWAIIAGGPSVAGGGTFAGLPDAMIHAFVFDVKDDRRGVFAGVRNHGLYYARLNADGTLDGSYNNGQFAKITDADLDAVIPTSSTGGHHYYSRLMFDPDSADHLYVSRHWPAGGVFRIKLVSNRTNLDPANCIVQVEEVIKGRFNGAAAETGVDTSKTAEVINLLITPTHVFAGVTGGHQADQDSLNYAGGLVRWEKNDVAGRSFWKIGGPDSLGRPGFNIAIGGLAQDPANPNTILAVTYRFGLRADRLISSGKYRGEDNYKLMNLWQSTDGGETFSALPNSVTQHKWPDAVTLAFVPGMNDTLIMPTHGNGIWIGTRPDGAPKIVAQPDSTRADDGLPKRFALHPNYPNPFNPVTVMKFDLPKATHVTLIIYDVLGRRVRTLIDEPMKAGYHAKIWDGRNHQGVSVASGVYFYRLHTTEFDKVRKLAVVK
ncbi:T9SS type A sorting domain-containing protein [candidate division KSB1 bacterium]|nr:T9SS type A sorting domain-containing protein [bacterium]NUM65762.1 T9SS type A sorting domain-containing protein [candidate division KSB1 bacterium]